MAASSSLPIISQRLAALALGLVLLLDVTMPSLVFAGQAKGGANKGGGRPKGGANKGGGHKGGAHKGVVNVAHVGTVKPAPAAGGAIPKPNVNPAPAAGAGGAVPAGGSGSVPTPGNGEPITYHGGPLMNGDINLSIIFYGGFKTEQRNLVRSFLRSLENTENDHIAAVHRWWDIVESYQLFTGPNPAAGTPPRLRIKVGTQQSDDSYSVGKVLTMDFIKALFQKADSGKPNTLVVIFADRQVTVQGLCMGKCYAHGLIDNKPYLVVVDPEVECPGACAWPFIRLDYGVPNQVTVKPPSGNAGIDAMIINFASGLAACVTNPFNTGFFKPGPKGDPIEACTECENIFGSRAVPGHTGKVEVDPATGASYNAVGEMGTKFMLPAIWNPRTSSCWTAL